MERASPVERKPPMEDAGDVEGATASEFAGRRRSSKAIESTQEGSGAILETIINFQN